MERRRGVNGHGAYEEDNQVTWETPVSPRWYPVRGAGPEISIARAFGRMCGAAKKKRPRCGKSP